MIDIGKIYCGGSSTGDGLRYGTEAPVDAHGNQPHEIQKSSVRSVIMSIACLDSLWVRSSLNISFPQPE